MCLFCFFLENSICDCTKRCQRQSDLGVQVIMVTSAERLFVIRHRMRSQRWKMSVILSEGKEGVTLCVRKALHCIDNVDALLPFLDRLCFLLKVPPLLPRRNTSLTKQHKTIRTASKCQGYGVPRNPAPPGTGTGPSTAVKRPTQQNASTRWALVTQPGPGRFMSLGTILCFLWNVWPDPLCARQCYFSITSMTFIFSFSPTCLFLSCGQNKFWRKCSLICLRMV